MDFYEFSCQNWNKNNPIPLDQYSWTNIDMINDNINVYLRNQLENTISDLNSSKTMNLATKLYQSCLNIGNNNNNLLICFLILN